VTGAQPWRSGVETSHAVHCARMTKVSSLSFMYNRFAFPSWLKFEIEVVFFAAAFA